MAYLLSSQSYPDRMIDIEGTTAMVIPRGNMGRTYPPSLFYNCIKVVKLKEKTVLLVGNGSHTDYIETMVPRESDLEEPVSEILQVLGCERDEQKTPRILGIASTDELMLGLASEKGLDVKMFQAEPGKAYYVSTKFVEVGKYFLEDFSAQTALQMINIFKETEPFRGFTDYLGSAAANLIQGKLDLACD